VQIKRVRPLSSCFQVGTGILRVINRRNKQGNALPKRVERFSRADKAAECGWT